MLELPRRSFITGIIAASCAPAIVRADSLMKVKPVKGWWNMTFDELNPNGFASDYEPISFSPDVRVFYGDGSFVDVELPPNHVEVINWNDRAVCIENLSTRTVSINLDGIRLI